MTELHKLHQFSQLFDEVKLSLKKYNTNLKNELFEKEPNEENESLDNHPSTTEDVLDKVDVPFTISNEFPEDSKPIDEQLSLF